MTEKNSFRDTVVDWAIGIAIATAYIGLQLLFAYLLSGLDLTEFAALCGVVVVAMTLWHFASKAFDLDDRPRAIEWRIDHEGVTLSEAGEWGREATISYSSLEWVAIETSDLGPFAEDFHYLLDDDEKTISVPLAVACEHDLLEYLGGLPGFDHTKVIEAAGSTEPALFVCWERDRSPRSEELEVV